MVGGWNKSDHEIVWIGALTKPRSLVRIYMNTNEHDSIMSKTVTLRLDDATYAFFRDCAQADNRTLSNMIETAAKRHLESAYVDPEEQREILADKPLMRRIRAGERDAKHRRGRMIG